MWPHFVIIPVRQEPEKKKKSYRNVTFLATSQLFNPPIQTVLKSVVSACHSITPTVVTNVAIGVEFPPTWQGVSILYRIKVPENSTISIKANNVDHNVGLTTVFTAAVPGGSSYLSYR